MAPFRTMKPLPATIGRFDARALLHEAGTSALYLGLDTTSHRPVVIQVVRTIDPQAREQWLGTARRLEAMDHRSLATLIAAGADGDDVYATFAVAPEGETLESFLRRPQAFSLSLDQRLAIVLQLCVGLEDARRAGVIGLNARPGFIWITPALTVQIAGLMAPPDTSRPADDDVYAMPTSVDTSSSVAGGDVYTLVAVLVELLTNQRPQRTANGTIDLSRLRANQLGPSTSGTASIDVEARIADIVTLGLNQGKAPSLDLAGLRRELEAALAHLSVASATIVMPAPPVPAAPAPPPPVAADEEPASLVYDEHVQFTVYRPRILEPGKWHPLLAFAHLSERRPDAPADEPDPTAEVARQASAVLGDLSAYRQVSEDSSQGIPRDGEITFVPSVPGADFNPRTQSFLWTESVHRAEFRVRAQAALPKQILHGRMSVYLGAILLAEINLSFGIGQASPSRPDTIGESARPYRKIFASYSHRDDAIVRQNWDYAKALGDEYLQDVINLRSGERWVPALEKLIREADVFQLFWSWNALQSDYVQNEWRYALGLRRTAFIRPVYWDDPFPARGDLPPKDLLDLHFQRIASWATLASSSPAATLSSTDAVVPATRFPPAPPQPPAPPPAPTQSATPPPAVKWPPDDRAKWPDVPSPVSDTATMRVPSGSDTVTMRAPSASDTATVRTPSASDTVTMRRPEPLPDVASTQPAPRRSSGVKWRVLSAVAAMALVAIMLPTIYRTGGRPNSGTATLPSQSPPVAVGSAPPAVGTAFTALSVVVATEAGPVVNTSDDVRVQLIDKTTNQVVARAVLKPDGTAEFPSVPPGEYTIAANVPGLETAAESDVSVSATAPAAIQKVLTMRRRAPVPGRGVRGRAGRAGIERIP
jgi:TIR domain-containing protein